MADVMLQIQMLDDGSLRVVDSAGNPLPSLTPEEFSRKLAGKEVKKSHIVTAMYTNPCGWVEIGGEWYWQCW